MDSKPDSNLATEVATPPKPGRPAVVRMRVEAEFGKPIAQLIDEWRAELLDGAEMARRAGVPEPTLRAWISRGQLLRVNTRERLRREKEAARGVDSSFRGSAGGVSSPSGEEGGSRDEA